MNAMRASADLSGRVAIVTGAGARGDGIGNGRAAAILLAEAGAHVLAVDRKPDLAAATVDMISAEGGGAVAIGADVTVESDCEAMTQAASRCGDRHGPRRLADPLAAARWRAAASAIGGNRRRSGCRAGACGRRASRAAFPAGIPAARDPARAVLGRPLR